MYKTSFFTKIGFIKGRVQKGTVGSFYIIGKNLNKKLNL